MKFYICELCGNEIGMIKESGVPVVCCGQDMTELVPHMKDGAVEKHLPVCSMDGRTLTVTVGETEHPMNEQHFIEWIAVETAEGAQRKELKPGEKPAACFALTEGDSVSAVYAYCNIHGLWKSDVTGKCEG